MFDFVQDKKWLVQIVLAVIILTFAVWGISSYQNTSGPEPLAKVNGEKIGPQEFEKEMNEQRDLFRERAGANSDMAIFDKPETKRSVLEGLVTQHVLASDARRAGLWPSDAQVAQILVSISDFHKNGKFDKETYLAALKARRKNQADFERRLERGIAIRPLVDAYAQNGFAADSVVERLIRLSEQQRVVALSSLSPESFLKQVKVSEADIADYYDKHANEFQLPERANVDYVLFSADALLPTITVADKDVKRYYEEHTAEFETQQEQRQAAHILISVSKQATEAEKQVAKAKAEEVLKQVKQSSAKFSALAKQYSQDPGSAAKGGDLGMVGPGMWAKSFEDAEYALKVGEVSGLVETEYGYHIIKLVAIKPAKVQALADVRSMIEQRLKLQLAADKFAEKAVDFSNIVFEERDSLIPAAELLKTTVQHGGWLSKGQAANGIWSDKVLQAVFSEDVLKNKRNTAAIETAANTLVAARVLEYRPASARPLAEVASGIRQSLQRQRAAEIADKQGTEMLASLQRGDKVSLSWKAAQTLSRNQRTEIAPELLQAVFRADTAKLPAYVGVATSQGGYLLARIDAVKEGGAIDDGKRNGYAQQIRQMTGEELLMAYLADAKKRADIRMKEFVAEEKK